MWFFCDGKFTEFSMLKLLIISIKKILEILLIKIINYKTSFKMKKRKISSLSLGKCRIASLNKESKLLGGTNGHNTNTLTVSDDVKKCPFSYTCNNCPPAVDSKVNCAVTDDC